jgi:hypothetical protein
MWNVWIDDSAGKNSRQVVWCRDDRQSTIGTRAPSPPSRTLQGNGNLGQPLLVVED